MSDQDEILACAYCLEEIQTKSAGDESWDFCENCQQVEGDTVFLSPEEYEKAHV